MSPPLIHVVDDDESLRTALLRLLRAAGFDACGHASSGDFLLNPLPDRPGCLLLDVRMPGPSGLELQLALRRRAHPLPIIFLTGQADLAAGVQAMKAGAVDFLSKPVTREVLLDAVERALAVDARQRLARAEADSLQRRFASLNPRELEVFHLIVTGRLNKQTADALGIAERTVKLHRARVMEKLGVTSPAELGRLAEQLRQLSGSEPN